MWQGIIALKTNETRVQMHKVTSFRLDYIIYLDSRHWQIVVYHPLNPVLLLQAATNF